MRSLNWRLALDVAQLFAHRTVLSKLRRERLVSRLAKSTGCGDCYADPNLSSTILIGSYDIKPRASPQ